MEIVEKLKVPSVVNERRGRTWGSRKIIMAYVMIMVICIANDYLLHDELCKLVTLDKPF